MPSMLHGKKGFERVVWAFKNVLNSAVTWLLYDPGDENGKNHIGKATHVHQRGAITSRLTTDFHF